MHTQKHFPTQLSPALAFLAIRAGRQAVDAARRAQDTRAERAARREIEIARRIAREAADARI